MSAQLFYDNMDCVQIKDLLVGPNFTYFYLFFSTPEVNCCFLLCDGALYVLVYIKSQLHVNYFYKDLLVQH